MKLRCMVGDLARVTHGSNRDRFVSIVAKGDGSIHGPSGLTRDWFIEAASPLLVMWGMYVGRSHSCAMPDAWLVPIRDQDGLDETLAWKPVPLPVINELAPKPQREELL